MVQYIIDNEGKRIEVENLPKAIKQAELFIKFDVHDKERTEYWKDILEKLKELSK